MKIIKDNTQSKIETCEKCGSILECSPADYITQNEYASGTTLGTDWYNSIDMEYFDCPCCGHRNYLKCTLNGTNLLTKTNKN